MLEIEDWLQDPLRKLENDTYKTRKLKSPKNNQNDLWHSFHFSTRLKLDGADYFCRQVLGAASIPDTLGLPLLAHRLLKWYLDTFFFELISAYDILLQELNIVYAYGLKVSAEEVHWKKLKDNLPKKIVEYMEMEWEKEWFKKVRRYRNMATHYSYLWTGYETVGSGDSPWDYNQYGLSIYYLDENSVLKNEKVTVCVDYLKNMVAHIQKVWETMAEQFE